MTSSQIAQTVLTSVAAVSALLLTSAQLRVIRRPPPRRAAYVVAWLTCTLVLGGLLVLTDRGVGSSTPARMAANSLLAAAATGVALAAGAWWTRRPSWSGPLRALTLFVVHAIVVLLVGYPFI